MVGLFEDFYTPRGVERRIPLTLTFYVKGYKKINKQSIMTQ